MVLTDREAWLLNEVSSVGRVTIHATQYDELRALANHLLAERNKAVELRKADWAEVVFTGGKW